MHLNFWSLADSQSDRDFFEKEVYIKHYALMKRAAIRTCWNTSISAEDLINEACVRLIDKIDKLKALESNDLSAYIYMTVRSIACKRAKKTAARLLKEADAAMKDIETVPSMEASPELVLEKREQESDLQNVLLCLPELDRMVLYCKYYWDMSGQEIAEELGISREYVYVRLHRAKERALKLLDQQEVDDR